MAEQLYERGVNEWGDPKPILEDDKQPDEEDLIRRVIERAVHNAYHEQATAVAIERPVGFKLEQYTVIKQHDNGITCTFTVTKILRLAPVTQYDGTVVLYEDNTAPHVEFDSLQETPDITGFITNVLETLHGIFSTN